MIDAEVPEELDLPGDFFSPVGKPVGKLENNAAGNAEDIRERAQYAAAIRNQQVVCSSHITSSIQKPRECLDFKHSRGFFMHFDGWDRRSEKGNKRQ